jgi:hypothetical protein
VLRETGTRLPCLENRGKNRADGLQDHAHVVCQKGVLFVGDSNLCFLILNTYSMRKYASSYSTHTPALSSFLYVAQQLAGYVGGV